MSLRQLYTYVILIIACQFAVAPVLADETQTNWAVDIVVFENSQAKYLNSEKWPTPPHPATSSTPIQSSGQQPAATTPATTPTQNTAVVSPPSTAIPATNPAAAPMSAPEGTTASPVTPAPLHIPPTDVFLSNPGSAGSSSQTMAAGNQSVAPATSPDTATSNPDIHAINPGKYDLLNADVRRLIASPNYHVLVRKSWIQPGLDGKHAVSIDMNSADDPESAGAAGTLTGSVKIVLERYLHLYTDLVYHRPVTVTSTTPDGDSSTTPPASVPEIQDFVIKQHRRMRSNELHYLDHPMVGILIKIVPVKSDSQPGQ